MSKFLNVATQVSDADVITPEGKKQITAAMSNLDTLWDDVCKYTLGVLLATMACSSDKVVAHEALDGILTMMRKMSEAYQSTLGWSGNPVDHQELLDLAKNIDAKGQKLAQKVDMLGAAVMTGLLGPLPKEWTQYFLLLIATRDNMPAIIVPGAISYLSSMLADIQGEKTKGLVKMAHRSVLSLNSLPAKRAMEWNQAAGGVFEALIAGGYTMPTALGETIKQVGFPMVGAKNA
jgi:hypothetical protein